MIDFKDFYPTQTELEICLVLFDSCNLGCKFCFQEHNEVPDVESISNVFNSLRPQLDILLFHRPHIKNIVFRIWGGEVFMDSLSDDYFTAYEELCNNIKQHLLEKHIESTFAFSSNLVCSDINRVVDFLDRNEFECNTSYDPIDRFHTSEQENIWFRNVEIVRPKCISITLTKPAIEQYLSTDVLSKLSPYTLYPEYYIHAKDWEKYAPTMDDLFSFYKHCHDNNITNIPEIANIINSYQNPSGRYCTCNASYTFKNNILTSSCLIRSSSEEMLHEFGFSVEDCSSIGCVKKQYEDAVNKLGCELCPHFAYCRLTCPVSVLHKDYSCEKCALSEFYQYIGEQDASST